ncbi:MAG: hypothetical protein WBM41_00275 [Arenicellales bacterium]
MGTIVMAAGAVIGAGITLAVFDMIIIVASASSGAGMAMDGLNLIFRNVDILDRTGGGTIPLVIWVFVGALAMSWQFMNLAKWLKNTG